MCVPIALDCRMVYLYGLRRNTFSMLFRIVIDNIIIITYDNNMSQHIIITLYTLFQAENYKRRPLR